MNRKIKIGHLGQKSLEQRIKFYLDKKNYIDAKINEHDYRENDGTLYNKYSLRIEKPYNLADEYSKPYEDVKECFMFILEFVNVIENKESSPIVEIENSVLDNRPGIAEYEDENEEKDILFHITLEEQREICSSMNLSREIDIFSHLYH